MCVTSASSASAVNDKEETTVAVAATATTSVTASVTASAAAPNSQHQRSASSSGVVATLPVADANISDPLNFHHNIKVVFNEEFSRYSTVQYDSIYLSLTGLLT